jgi:hypothetical protein
MGLNRFSFAVNSFHGRKLKTWRPESRLESYHTRGPIETLVVAGGTTKNRLTKGLYGY